MNILATVLRAALGGLAFALSVSAFAATPETIHLDLRPLIRQAAKTQVQFAVSVPHDISTHSAGTWSETAGIARWHYATRIPTAVSMSFHATPTILPASATLTVQSKASTVVYRGRDLGSRDFWSRIQIGDSLQFTLAVARSERALVQFHIVSLQAGYRGLGGAVADHPYYRKLQEVAASTGNASCVQNYECNVTAANTPAGQAAVAIVVGNMYQCSGTLLNDVPGDNLPYVLTARHCETGTLGGGNPGAASDVTVYWDAITACGQTLGTLYDSIAPRQTGATTIVEQQDLWLIKLDLSPVVTDAQFAGFDATGAAVIGGYTIHHALGFDKQFTGWFGQALSVQQPSIFGSAYGLAYASNFLEVVNQQGNTGPGASGSGLFDQNNHLVGSLTLGRTGDASGYESCPVANPSPANGSNGAADFTALAAAWSSNADPTGSATATLASTLDPASTGTLVVSSLPAANISFTAAAYIQTIAGAVQLSWNAGDAVTCTASGGTPGDGWTGALAGSGSQSVTEPSAGAVSYGLACTLTTGRLIHASLTITWFAPQAQAYLNSSTDYLWATRPLVLSWTANVTPCAITGGSLASTNLGSSGAVTTTQSTAGDVTYQLSCGSGSNTDLTALVVHYVTPSLEFEANSTDRLLGQPLVLVWSAFADSCTPSGGAPDDGWSVTNLGPQGQMTIPNLTTPGTFTYTLTCTSGPISVQESVVVAIENNAPYVSASVDPVSTTYTASPADYFTVSWISNLTLCSWSSNSQITGVAITPGIQHDLFPQDSATLEPGAPGTYVVTVTCTDGVGTAPQSVTSSPVTVTMLPPPAPTATLSVSPTSIVVDQQFTITWSSTNALACFATQNGPGALWGPDGLSGSQLLSITESGQFTFAISCESIVAALGSATAQATLVVAPLPPTSVGAPPTTGSNSGGGSSSHGGGAFDFDELGCLAAMLLWRRNRARALGARRQRNQSAPTP
jgi:lysyl endopeptidase